MHTPLLKFCWDPGTDAWNYKMPESGTLFKQNLLYQTVRRYLLQKSKILKLTKHFLKIPENIFSGADGDDL